MNFGGMFDGAGSGVFSYDAGGGAGTHNPGGRLIPAPPIPKPGGGFASPGLSLGLVRSLDPLVGFPDPTALLCADDDMRDFVSANEHGRRRAAR
jgi:hypothetical protein